MHMINVCVHLVRALPHSCCNQYCVLLRQILKWYIVVECIAFSLFYCDIGTDIQIQGFVRPAVYYGQSSA